MLEREAERLSATGRRTRAHRTRRSRRSPAMAAHELVEPLVITEAYATMVARAPARGRARGLPADLASVAARVARMRLLLEALLHDARAGDRAAPRERQVDLAPWSSATAWICSAGDRGARGRVTVGPLPTVHGHEALLNGLFTNLLMNALKYSPRSGAEIAVSASPARAASGRSRSTARARRSPRGPRADLRPLAARARRAPRPRRRPRAGDLPPHRRAARRRRSAWSPPGGRGNRFYFTLPA